MESFKLNPVNPTLAMISSYSMCDTEQHFKPCEFRRDLYVSNFNEESIIKVGSGIEQFEW